MRTLISSRWSAVRFLLIVFAASSFLGCSVPNLEEPDCREARDVVREFYSLHFGNDMHPSAANVRLREKYLTPRLKDTLLAATPGDTDYFTATSDYPKAFRVGECKIKSPGQSANFDVLLFWKDDVRSEQKHISVAVEKENGAWRIGAVN